MLNHALLGCMLAASAVNGCPNPNVTGADITGVTSTTGTASSTPDGGATGGSTQTTSAAVTTHHRCGWPFSSDPTAAASFTAHADWFDAVHRCGSRSTATAPRCTSSAMWTIRRSSRPRARHVALIQLVASVENTDWTRAMLRDPVKRAAHEKALVAIATSHGYDGLDLDYEHLWDPTDSAPLAAFIDDIGAARRAAGKQISMAVPALDADSTV